MAISPIVISPPIPLLDTVGMPEGRLVPIEVAVCPYCGAQLCIWSVDAMEERDERDGVMVPSELHLDCTTEPDIDAPGWQDWFDAHSVMPYVYMLPVDIKVREWFASQPETWRRL